jgi:hypothetical protein
MNQLGRDTSFSNARNAWSAVSADLASLVSPTEMTEIELQLLLVEAGKPCPEAPDQEAASVIVAILVQRAIECGKIGI